MADEGTVKDIETFGFLASRYYAEWDIHSEPRGTSDPGRARSCSDARTWTCT